MEDIIFIGIQASGKSPDSQILSILKQNESGVSVPDLCREHGMSSACFDQWRA